MIPLDVTGFIELCWALLCWVNKNESAGWPAQSCLSCLFMRSEIDWAKSWVVADILTRRDQGYQNQILHGPALSWLGTQLSGDISDTLTLRLGTEDHQVKIIDQYSPDLSGFVRLWWVRGLIMNFPWLGLTRKIADIMNDLVKHIIIPLTHYSDWRGYEESRNVTDGRNGQSVLALATIIHLYYPAISYSPTTTIPTLCHVSLFFNNPWYSIDLLFPLQ